MKSGILLLSLTVFSATAFAQQGSSGGPGNNLLKPTSMCKFMSYSLKNEILRATEEEREIQKDLIQLAIYDMGKQEFDRIISFNPSKDTREEIVKNYTDRLAFNLKHRFKSQDSSDFSIDMKNISTSTMSTGILKYDPENSEQSYTLRVDWGDSANILKVGGYSFIFDTESSKAIMSIPTIRYSESIDDIEPKKASYAVGNLHSLAPQGAALEVETSYDIFKGQFNVMYRLSLTSSYAKKRHEMEAGSIKALNEHGDMTLEQMINNYLMPKECIVGEEEVDSVAVANGEQVKVIKSGAEAHGEQVTRSSAQ